ncbi:MAG: zinc ribbon domain-containing protein [Verrucomicrobia bacterium]|nr:zinc ribbon domain-containing protein [Verrucomicrobiota bacterium]
MAERLRSALETLINVRDETNGLAPSGEERRRRRSESIEALRGYSVPALFLVAGAIVIAVATHFLVWSLIDDLLMPLIYSALPGLAAVNIGGDTPLKVGPFISYLLYAAGMVGVAVLVLRGALAKPRGYVRERTRTCPACGMTVYESATRCRYCGSPLATRRTYAASAPVNRAAGPTISSPRTSASSEHDDRPPRRGRRGGRRRGGRSRTGSGSGGGSDSRSGSGSPTGTSGSRSDS